MRSNRDLKAGRFYRRKESIAGRERPKKALWEHIRDWASFAMAAVAFVVSLLSSYFTLVRQEDNLSITFRSMPTLIRTDDETFMIKWPELNVVLINDGNRSAVISKLALSVYQYDDEPEESCNYKAAGQFSFDTSFEPLVLKDKEVAYRKIRVTNGHSLEKAEDGTYQTFISKTSKGKDRIPVEVCLRVTFSTPSFAEYYTTLSLDFQRLEREWVSGARYEPEPPKPMRLIRSFGTVF